MHYLLDTNVLSEPLMARPDNAVLERLKRFEGELATATPVWHELVFGCRRLAQSKKRSAIERYLEEVVLATLAIIPYDLAAATWHGEERARLAGAGRTPSFVDGQIAAIAHVHDLVLVTRNTSDFKPFRGIKIENWFTAPRKP
jgi:tRNA(fMet)-specific endonuclease VapC